VASSRERVRADDVVYQSRREAEARYWERSTVSSMMAEVLPGSAALARVAYPGRVDWLDDLAGRGPFEHAAVLGCDDEDFERRWMARAASARLDVYELSPRVLARVGAALPDPARVRLVPADLNFALLPAERYDVVWSSGVLHHVANLERLYDQVARALRPGGLFAIHDYVGERRLQYEPARLARINAVLRDVPERFRRGGVGAVTAPGPETLSPFCGIRSDEVVALAEARFDVVRRVDGGSLFPLYFMLDVAAMEREDPEAFARLVAAELAADADPAVRHCSVYLLLRRR
jgi:SAM-dependent methyltransferase